MGLHGRRCRLCGYLWSRNLQSKRSTCQLLDDSPKLGRIYKVRGLVLAVARGSAQARCGTASPHYLCSNLGSGADVGQLSLVLSRQLFVCTSVGPTQKNDFWSPGWKVQQISCPRACAQKTKVPGGGCPFGGGVVVSVGGKICARMELLVDFSVGRRWAPLVQTLNESCMV